MNTIKNVNQMNSKPLISIITPTYNHEEFIGQCIESVLAQTYAFWEQIIVDDGSTDKTADIISDYRDKRIKYIRQSNQGIWKLGRSYNKALDISRGKYIAILEGDDFWPPDKLEMQIRAMEETGAVLGWGKARIINSRSMAMAVSPEDIRPFMGMSKEQMMGALLFENPIPSPTVVCLKSALDQAGGFKQPAGLPYVDEPTWLQLCLQGEFLAENEIRGCYRRHEAQVTAYMLTTMIRASRYSIDFFHSLPADVRANLAERVPGLNEKLLRKEIEYDYYLGRANLLEGKYAEARMNFLKALGRGHASHKAKALIGIISSLCKIDLERLDDLSKKCRIRK
jgi:glycosyltransferase involved in cell wall biosynthesis